MLDFASYLSHSGKHFKLGSGFWSLHLDTMIVSTLVASAIVCYFYFCIYHDRQNNIYCQISTHRNIVEYIYEKLAKETIIPQKFTALGVAYLTSLYSWIGIMNMIEVLPNSLITIVQKCFVGKDVFKLQSSFKLVPTDDINMTLALAVVTLCFINVLIMRCQGILQFLKHLLTEPFGIYAAPFNLAFYLLESVSLAFGLCMRLFINLGTGSLVSISCAAFPLPIGSLVYLFWNLMHTPILILQTVIFAEITKLSLDKMLTTETH